MLLPFVASLCFGDRFRVQGSKFKVKKGSRLRKSLIVDELNR
jgi:hypothetical protein